MSFGTGWRLGRENSPPRISQASTDSFTHISGSDGYSHENRGPDPDEGRAPIQPYLDRMLPPDEHAATAFEDIEVRVANCKKDIEDDVKQIRNVETIIVSWISRLQKNDRTVPHQKLLETFLGTVRNTFKYIEGELVKGATDDLRAIANASVEEIVIEYRVVHKKVANYIEDPESSEDDRIEPKFTGKMKRRRLYKKTTAPTPASSSSSATIQPRAPNAS